MLAGGMCSVCAAMYDRFEKAGSSGDLQDGVPCIVPPFKYDGLLIWECHTCMMGVEFTVQRLNCSSRVNSKGVM